MLIVRKRIETIHSFAMIHVHHDDDGMIMKYFLVDDDMIWPALRYYQQEYYLPIFFILVFFLSAMHNAKYNKLFKNCFVLSFISCHVVYVFCFFGTNTKRSYSMQSSFRILHLWLYMVLFVYGF